MGPKFEYTPFDPYKALGDKTLSAKSLVVDELKELLKREATDGKKDHVQKFAEVNGGEGVFAGTVY